MKDKEILQSLSQIPFWNDMPKEFAEFCLSHGIYRHYNAKKYIYFSGDESNYIYILLKGRIQIILTSEFTEKIFKIIKTPTFFPEIIFDRKPYPNAALALTSTDILSIDREQFINFIEKKPEILWLFYKSMALDLRRAFRQIKNLSLGDARLRLGAKLFALAHAHGKKDLNGIIITIPLSATELAGMCGLARESVSRILTELRESQIIATEKKSIRVCDIELLRKWIKDRFDH